VVIPSELDLVCAELAGLGFTISQHRFSVNAQLPGSGFVVQLTTDSRCQDFLQRATPAEVLGVQCRVAALADLFQGKLWATSDPEHRATKRANDELDLVRIVDAYPEYLPLLPEALRAHL
jgi:hypothetical protein